MYQSDLRGGYNIGKIYLCEYCVATVSKRIVSQIIIKRTRLYDVSERVTKIENIKTDSTKILRPTRQKILRPTVFLSVLLSKKEGE